MKPGVEEIGLVSDGGVSSTVADHVGLASLVRSHLRQLECRASLKSRPLETDELVRGTFEFAIGLLPPGSFLHAAKLAQSQNLAEARGQQEEIDPVPEEERRTHGNGGHRETHDPEFLTSHDLIILHARRRNVSAAA
jgi:hypothetical protein